MVAAPSRGQMRSRDIEKGNYGMTYTVHTKKELTTTCGDLLAADGRIAPVERKPRPMGTDVVSCVDDLGGAHSKQGLCPVRSAI